MDDKIETKEEKPATDDNDEGIQQKTISELDRADQIVERQKRENDRREKILEREEALLARKAVGGDTGFIPPKEEKKEISNKEYAEKALSGELNAKEE